MRNNKINVVFVLPSLNPGGAERVMSFVAQNLDKQEFNASLWVISKSFENDYPIKDIEVKHFGKSRVLKSVFPLIKNIFSEKPDIIISSIGHLNQMMGLISILFPKTNFIGREANVLSVLSQFHTKKSYGHRLFRFSYLSLDKILCTSKDMVNDFKQVYGFPDDKLALINNPISHKFNGQKKTKNDCVPIQFITVGSLKKQKGHERILKALSKLNFDFNYTMIGDGNERKKIMELVKELKLDNKITHIPYTKKVDEHLSSSDLFLQGAYVEGFPNCLLESAATGLPIVAFNAVGGLNEIVEVGKNGYIAQNENEFVSLVYKSIFEENWDYQEISRNTHKKYGAEKILNKYETLFKTMVN